MHESTAGGTLSFRSFEIVDAARAAAGGYFDGRGIGDGAQRLDIVAFAHAVAADLGENDTRHAPLRHAAHERVAIDGRSLLPTAR